MAELRREDVQSAWFETFDRDDWGHIVAFANAVVNIASVRASLDADQVRRIADSVQKRGRKHCSGESLTFDRHNLERAIGAAMGQPEGELRVLLTDEATTDRVNATREFLHE